MAIGDLKHLQQHINILYFRPPSDASAETILYTQESDTPPSDLVPYPSGFTLLTIREPLSTWPAADQKAFADFMDEPRNHEFMEKLMNAVVDAQQRIVIERGLPTPFESLAAINFLSKASECAPEFYERHRQAFDMAAGFIGCLCMDHPGLATIFAFTLTPLSRTASLLEQFLRSTPLPNFNMEWVDAQMTIQMEMFIPVVRDPELPAFYEECRWPIEGALEEIGGE